MPYAIGLDVGGTFLKAALVEASRGVVRAMRLPTRAAQGPERVIRQMAEAVRLLLAEAPEPPLGIGIGCAGHVDQEGRTVSYPPNFPGWTVVPLVDRLRAHLDWPALIALDNDANAAARGEAAFGAGRGMRHFLLLTLGTGVGGAVVLDGRLWRGLSGGAGEFGHMTIHYRGPRCNCGARGCIEAYVGERYVLRRARRLLKKHPESSLAMRLLRRTRAGVRDLVEAAQAGDELARAVLAEAGRLLGYALASAVHLLDVRCIIVGGGVAQAGGLLLEPAQEALLERLMPPFRDGLELRPAALGNQAGVLGAAQLIFERACAGP